MYLHVILDEDWGPELAVLDSGGIAEVRLVVKLINEVFGIPNRLIILMKYVQKSWTNGYLANSY